MRAYMTIGILYLYVKMKTARGIYMTRGMGISPNGESGNKLKVLV